MTRRRFHNRKPISTRALLALLLVLILVLVVPEMSVLVDLMVMLDVLGAELLLFAIFVGLRLLPWWSVVSRLKSWRQAFDPYFFVPTAQQAKVCPALMAHAVPGFLPLILAVAVSGTVLAMLFRESGIGT